MRVQPLVSRDTHKVLTQRNTGADKVHTKRIGLTDAAMRNIFLLLRILLPL
jgi:hypothetical protein